MKYHITRLNDTPAPLYLGFTEYASSANVHRATIVKVAHTPWSGSASGQDEIEVFFQLQDGCTLARRFYADIRNGWLGTLVLATLGTVQGMVDLQKMIGKECGVYTEFRYTLGSMHLCAEKIFPVDLLVRDADTSAEYHNTILNKYATHVMRPRAVYEVE